MTQDQSASFDAQYETIYVPMRFERPVGRTLKQWRENVSKTDLYRRGDTVLVWVNEGDLGRGPFVEQYRRRAPEIEARSDETTMTQVPQGRPGQAEQAPVDYSKLLAKLEAGIPALKVGDIRRAATAIRQLVAEREAMREAIRPASGLSSGPNGYGEMRIVIDGFKPGEEATMFYILSDLYDRPPPHERPER